jgi:hypothetical protein
MISINNQGITYLGNIVFIRMFSTLAIPVEKMFLISWTGFKGSELFHLGRQLQREMPTD